MAVKNHNFRFNEEKEAERQAWEILHSKEVKEDFRSQNEFVIAAINDYYARHLATKQDPYLESREKEDVKKYEMEPELNELLDFSFCGD